MSLYKGFPSAEMSFAVLFFLLCGFAGPSASALGSPQQQNFLQCLLSHSPDPSSLSRVTYTPANSSYLSVYQSTISNLRFLTPTAPKPHFIITPLLESDIVAAILCSKEHDLQVRIRSGGHDYEGLSYLSDVPFIIIDMTNLRKVSVDVESKTAWVQSGATIGELYYKIAEKSRTLGFPAGNCPTVGVGGHFGGGGYGKMMRKYGLAGDNVIDARLVVANGTVLTRESMGEDLFWAIRGGGAPSFAVVVAWKIKLVPVPPMVTIFDVARNSSQNATELVHRWQYIAHNLPKDLTLQINITVRAGTNGSGPSIQASFISLYLGKADDLLLLMHRTFPELGLVKKDCIEVSWIESVLVYAGFPLGSPLENLLNRSAAPNTGFYKEKSDYVTMPMSRRSVEGLWNEVSERRAGEVLTLVLVPYGGVMNEISASKLPFPHRAGNLYQIGYLLVWTEEGDESGKSGPQLQWLRRFYDYMTPLVSKSPRRVYLNYRDLDLGTNEKGNAVTSYQRASIWGRKYFDKNFDRLVTVKTKVDPSNFFRYEQSIPVVPGKMQQFN